MNQSGLTSKVKIENNFLQFVLETKFIFVLHKHRKFWALRTKLKASAGHIWPVNRKLCMPDINKQSRNLLFRCSTKVDENGVHVGGIDAWGYCDYDCLISSQGNL